MTAARSVVSDNTDCDLRMVVGIPALLFRPVNTLIRFTGATQNPRIVIHIR
jgi:hypothetical protein